MRSIPSTGANQSNDPTEHSTHRVNPEAHTHNSENRLRVTRVTMSTTKTNKKRT